MLGGRQLSDVADGPLQPTVQVADWSNTFVSEAIEPRAMVSIITTTTTVGNMPVVVFTALAPGGILIEDMKLLSLSVGAGPFLPQFPVGSWIPVRLGVDTPGQGTRYLINVNPATANTLQIGGPVTRSAVRFGGRSGPASQGLAFDPSYQLQPNSRIYVPPGEDLIIQHNASSDGAGTDPLGSVTGTFRELPGPIGLVEGRPFG